MNTYIPAGGFNQGEGTALNTGLNPWYYQKVGSGACLGGGRYLEHTLQSKSCTRQFRDIIVSGLSWSGQPRSLPPGSSVSLQPGTTEPVTMNLRNEERNKSSSLSYFLG